MTTAEIEANFPLELDAITFFERLRWGDSIHCAYCGTDKVSKRQADNRYHCSQCRKTFSVTTGTYMHGSKLPLRIWLLAFALTVQTVRLTLKQMQLELKVSYTTSWKIRQHIKSMKADGEYGNVVGAEFEYLCRKALTKPPVLEEIATV